MMQPPLPLHDIHLPEAAGWWPPAIGWWVVALILVFLLLWLILATRHWLRFHSWRKTLLNEFNQRISVSRSDCHVQVTAVTEALRQSALTLFPDDKIANLTGLAWLAFLESHGLHTAFTRSPGTMLIEAPYNDKFDCDPGSIDRLKQMATDWIRHNASRQHYQQLTRCKGAG